MTQKEIGKALIMVRKLIWLLDDGYHNSHIQKLVMISNGLVGELSQENDEKFTIWLEKKEKELRGE